MLGTIYLLNKNLSDALITLTRADRLLMDFLPNDSALHIDLHIDIGLIYFNFHRFQKATKYFTDLLPYKLTDEQKAQILNNLAIISIETNEFKKAITYLTDAEKVYAGLGYKGDLARVYNNMGSALEHIDPNVSDTIVYYYKKSASIKKELSDSVGIIAPMLNLSTYYIKKESYDLAKELVDQLYKYQSFFSNQDFANYYLTKSLIAEREGNHKISLANYKLYHNYNDSIQAIELKWQSTKAEQEIELEKKQGTITILEKEHAFAEAKTEQQRLIIILISVASTISIIILVLITNYYYKRQQLEKKLRNREVALASVSNLLKGQEEERLRIAKDLHDGVGNNLAVINAEILKNNSHENNLYLANLVKQTSEEVRSITHDLIPVAIRKFGLKEGIDDLAKKWKHASQVLIDVNYQGKISLDKNYSLTIYRIIQELIKNSVTHGGANYIHILISQINQDLNLVYEDTGTGFEVESLKNSEGIGFQNILNRVSYLNGKMDIESGTKGLKVSFVFTNIINEGFNS